MSDTYDEIPAPMKKDFEIDPKLSKSILHSMTESLYASGFFSDDDIKDEESYCLALKGLIVDNTIFNVTTDYTKGINEKARASKKANELDYARMFYATFFEHQINELVHLYCLRNKIDQKTQTTIIQSVNIWGKFTWLLQLMSYPKFNKNHLNTIKNLADSRNSFVHYKWKDDSRFNEAKNSLKEPAKIEEEFEKIEKAVKYFKNYCSKVKFNGKKKQIQKLFK